MTPNEKPLSVADDAEWYPNSNDAGFALWCIVGLVIPIFLLMAWQQAGKAPTKAGKHRRRGWVLFQFIVEAMILWQHNFGR